jgi:hypothetical protein
MERVMQDDLRARRLGRLKSLGDVEARRTLRAFAEAVAEAAGAAQRLSHIEGLLLSAGPPVAAEPVAGLAAAAQLRALLLPAVQMAEARLEVAVAERREAEARLAHSHARGARLNEAAARANVETRRVAEQRDMEARPAPARRRP